MSTCEWQPGTDRQLFMKIQWEAIEDSEYNEWVCDIGEDGNFILSSDRDGENWDLQYPEGETQRLDCEDEADAKAEARALIQDYIDAQG